MKQLKVTNPDINDLSSLKKMWKDIFKDEDSYIELFFNKKFKPETTLVIKEDGKIVSTLYAEETILVTDKKEYKGIYLCGIATREDKRGKGYAKEIIDEALERFSDYDIIYLIPANQGLFKFYEKFGLKPFTYLNEEKINLRETKEEKFTHKFEYETLNKFYENSGNGLYVKRSYEDFKAIYDCYKNIRIFEDGYIVYYIENETLHITEYSFSFDRAEETGSYIIKENNLSGGFILKKHGEIPFSCYKGKVDFCSINNKYVNLLLN